MASVNCRSAGPAWTSLMLRSSWESAHLPAPARRHHARQPVVRQAQDAQVLQAPQLRTHRACPCSLSWRRDEAYRVDRPRTWAFLRGLHKGHIRTTSWVPWRPTLDCSSLSGHAWRRPLKQVAFMPTERLVPSRPRDSMREHTSSCRPPKVSCTLI